LCDIPIPNKLGEAVIRVQLCGIHGTDLERMCGYYPFTGAPDHKFLKKSGMLKMLLG